LGIFFRKEVAEMNFMKIKKALRAGDHDTAIRLLKAMIFEAGLTQKNVLDCCIRRW
jgi:hypothetical protein